MNIEKDYKRLMAAHMDEALVKGAEFYNMGWATGDNFIHSKTDKGRLYSEIGIDGLITHAWDTREAACEGCGQPLLETESVVQAAKRHASCI